MGSKQLRFGILVNRLDLYPWQIRVFEEIIRTGMATCELVIIKEEEPSASNGIIKKMSAPHLFFEQYKKRTLNKSLYKPTYFSPIHAIEQLKVTPIRKGKASEYFEQKDIDLIKSKDLDFVIRFGFGILKGEVLKSARMGIWSFHHADEQEFRGGPAGFWEIFHRKKIQGVILQQLTEKLDAGKIILKRHYLVISSSYSANVTKLFMESADMPAQALKMIQVGQLNMSELSEVKTKAPLYHYPKNFRFIQFLFILLLNKIKLRWMVLFMQENWIIGYKTETQLKYKYVAGKKDGEYLADPFVFIKNNKPYIFAEEYSYHTQKGSIVLIEPGMNQITTIITKDTHLSYPFIFEEDGKVYIIPEESNTGKLNLYEWDHENKQAVFHQTLIDIPAIDSTILKHEGKYFLFTGIKGQLPNEKLFIFYSDSLKGPYHPHPLNPVKTSPEGSRMAGSFIKKEGIIIRPSQYYVKYYGEKVVFQKITMLSTTEYKEEYLDEMIPINDAPFKCGLHTYDKKANFEVIDLKKNRSGFTALKAKL